MSEQEQTTSDRLSKDDWYALGKTDPQAAEEAFRNGEVDLPSHIRQAIDGGREFDQLLGALGQSIEGVADAAEDEAPETVQAQKLGVDDEPERPLPDEKISHDHWKFLGREDPRFAQRIFDANLVDLPYWLREELR